MPRIGVTLPDGREIEIEGDQLPTEHDIDQIWSRLKTPETRATEREAIAADIESRQPSETLAKAQMSGAAGMAQALADPITGAANLLQRIPGMALTPTGLAATGIARLVQPLSEAGQAAEEAAAGMQGNEALAATANAIGSGVGSAPFAMVPGIGAGLSAGAAGMQSFESTRRDAVKTLIEAGADPKEAEDVGMKVALQAGVITAGVTAAFNRWGPSHGLGKGVERGLSKEVADVTAKEIARSALGQTLRKVAQEALGEGAEEATDQVLQEGIVRWQYDKSQTLTDSVKNVAKAFALGGVAGGVIGGPGAAAEVVGNRQEAIRRISRGDTRPREAGEGAPPSLSGVPGDTSALTTPVDLPTSPSEAPATGERQPGTYVYGTTAEGKPFEAHQPAQADPAAAKDYLERAMPGATISRVEIVSTPEGTTTQPNPPAQPQETSNGQEDAQEGQQKEGVLTAPADVGPAAESQPAAEPPPEPKKPRRIARQPVGDILDDIEQAGGLISKSQAKKLGLLENLGPEYDDAAPLAHPSHSFIYGNGTGGKGSLTPDKALQAIQAANPGKYADMTVPEMHAAMQAASRGRVADAGRRQQEVAAARTQADFEKSTSAKKGATAIQVGDLGVGETLTVDGEKVKVTGYDPGTGDVILDDGQRFGRQRVAPDAVLYVEKITPAGGRTRTKGQQASPDVPFSLGGPAGGDLFGAPESIADQKARLAREQAAAKAKADREGMLRRQAAPIIGRSVDTTGDMFDQSAADAPLFAQKPKPQQPRNGELFSTAPETRTFTPLGVGRTQAEIGRLFGGKVPDRVRVEPGQPTSNGARVEAYLANDGSIVIHGDNLSSPEDVRRVLRHESLHDVFEAPEVQAPWNRLMASMDRPARERSTRAEGYTANVLEESALDEAEARVDKKQPLFQRFVQGIVNAMYRRGWYIQAGALFGLDRLANADAKALVGYATQLDRLNQKTTLTTQKTGSVEQKTDSNEQKTAPGTNPQPNVTTVQPNAERFSLAKVEEDQERQKTAGRAATPLLARLAHDGAQVQAEMGEPGQKFSAWRDEMVRRYGEDIRPSLSRAWEHVRSLRYSLENGLPPETVADIADITAEANAAPSALDPKLPTPVYNPEMVAKWWHKLIRPSDVISRFGGEDMLRKRNLIDLRTAWQAAEVRKQSDALSQQLENSLYGDNAGPILRFIRQFAPKSKLRRFMKFALPIAARLNVTGGQPGAFEFESFQQRAGFMPESFAAKRGLETGQRINWADPITGKIESLEVGAQIVLEDGRKGYQLLRDLPAERQQRLYEWAQQEFPEFTWFLNTWVDPRLADTRIKVNGVDLPVFNRLALAGRYAEGDPGFTPRPAYTPDVGVGVGILRKFLTQQMVRFNQGTTSPGRFYETGEAREQGRTLDLLSGFNVRAMQVMQEQVRQEWTRHVMGKAEPIPEEGLPVGWTRIETAMQDIADADRQMRQARPMDFPQLDPDKPAPPLSANLERLFGKLARTREGPPMMIPQPLVEALKEDMATVQTFGLLGDLARVWAKNWKALLLLMPTTFAANRTDNYLRMLIEGHRQLWLAALKGGDREALRTARKLAYASMVNVIPGMRPILGLHDEALFRQVRETVLPPEVFGDSTRMRDLWVEKGDVSQEIASDIAQGNRKRAAFTAAKNIGPLILEKTGYGNIDVRAKQQFAFTLLLAKAEHEAWSRGLRGGVREGFIKAWMLAPPETAVASAVNEAGKNLLRYGDSPGWLGKVARVPILNTFVAFPMFRYHFVGREIDRATKALRLFHQGFVRGKKLTRDQWAEALADTISYVTLPLMGYAAAKVAGALTDSLIGAAGGGDDDDPRQFVGASSRFDVDADGNTVRKPLPRELVTANRLNISALLRQVGVETGSEQDYWWAMKDYPIVRSASLFYLAAEDARKHGPRAGIVTLTKGLGDLMVPLMGTGQAVKVPAKIAAELEGAEAGKPAFTSVDPYATNVPLSAYLTLQAMNLIPGQRQASELIKWLDPIPRRVTRSKALDYDPGVKEALQSEGWTGLADRLGRGLTTGDPSSPLPPQGTINKRLGFVESPRDFSLSERIAALLGQNVRGIPREEYQRAVEE